MYRFFLLLCDTAWDKSRGGIKRTDGVLFIQNCLRYKIEDRK